MSILNSSLNVPFSKKNTDVYLKVDKLIYLLVLVFALCVSSLYSQNQKRVDSLLQVVETQTDTTQIITYAQLWVEYLYVNPLASKPYLDSTIILAKRLKNDDFIARTTNYLGVYHNMTSQYEKSDSIYDLVIDMYTKLGDMTQVSYALNNKANSLRSLGRYNECLEVHMKSLKLKEEIGDTEESIAASYWNIGNIHGDIENFEISNDYYNKAKIIYQKLNLQDDVATINVNLALNLKGQKEYEKAKSLLFEAVPFYKEKNYNNDLAGAYDNIGWIYAQQDSLDIAEDYYNQALTISKQYGETSLIGLNLRHLGELYNQKGEYRKALNYMKEAIKIAEETGTRKKKIGDLLEISKAYAGLNRFKKAYEYHTDYHKLHDEILGEENIERMNELEVKYQSEKKEKELIIKENEIKLLEERKQRAENQKLFLIISLIGLLALAFAIVYALRQKMKRNKVEREKLDNSLQFKEKELTTHALHLAHKNEILLDLKSQLKELKSNNNPNSRSYQKVINTINLDINNDSNWDQFRNYFEEVHKDFNSNVMRTYPDVSNNDLRLMSLLKMNLSSKEIANILNISIEGVKKARYRLRKKLNLNTEESLQELVIEL
ncbi:tetratricopeptide repeat protein [Winogradskyella echinorum]|uniref:Tetratricopeptide repeat protein n=1 Tax=Winogradskyella echinorum TaxID=538189 RepID=A0ABR6Y298_9FLAO|nr:tetratricopeptide repeat protein [Winogradskyella echinorum]MBC3846779.1 tetratricopeptide repeat protein [Winogradskyella echinorum]MBC5751127.1 tetratricopeptide repeat protein [Winogradskyella echinorum]